MLTNYLRRGGRRAIMFVCLVAFGGDLVSDTDSGSLPLPLPLWNRGF